MNPSPSAWARVKSLFLRASESSNPGAVLQAAPGETAAAARRMLATGPGVLSNLFDAETAEPEPSVDTPWMFAPGNMVASRFEIVRLLGRGGMGEIYEALDEVKGIPVALKIVLPNSGIDPEIADRLLRREFSLAQMVSHRNICRIYDPYLHQRDQGAPLLVVSMELLRGKTLAAILSERGRLSAEEVTEIARQLAGGIDAAHAAGVVHRDLKPSNVIVVNDDDPRAVITDFGLARHAQGQTVTQLSSAVAGTLRYMAPEQMEGRADKLSDLYTFTFILFELLTGELPFAGDSDLSLALNRLSRAPRDPASVLPGISLAWRTTLLRGLSRQPEQRFQSAGELIRAIERPAPALVLWPRLVAIRVRGAPLAVRVALPLLLLAMAAAAFVFKPKPGPVAPFSRILIADLTHDETTDGAVLGAGASLAAAVGQSPHLTVVRPSELGSTLAKMGLPPNSPIDPARLRQLAIRTGEDAVLSGSISKGRGYSLHLVLEYMGSGPQRAAAIRTSDFDASDEKDLFRAVASAAEWVRKLSGEGAREMNEQNARPEDLTTGSWEALKLLQEARARRAANDPEGALLFAKEALGLDPGFAAAESFSADTRTDLRQYREAFEEYRRALDLAKARNVTGRERYEIEAAYDLDAGDDAASMATYEAWGVHFPKDYLPHFYVGYRLFHRGDYQQAVTELERAQQLGPSQFVILPHLAAAYLATGQLQQAQWCADRLRELGEDDWAREVEGLMLLSRRQFDAAAEKVTPLAMRKDGLFASVGPRYVASALADSGKLHDAEEVLSRADASHDMNSRAAFADRWLEVAFLRWAEGDFKGCRAALTQVVEDLDNPDSLSLAGALLARVGDLRAARDVLVMMGKWPNVPLVARASQRIKAEIAMASHGRAVNVFERWGPEKTASPLDLEFLLHAAMSAGDSQAVGRLRKVIGDRTDILLTWDEILVPPGFYWLAFCESGCRAH